MVDHRSRHLRAPGGGRFVHDDHIDWNAHVTQGAPKPHGLGNPVMDRALDYEEVEIAVGPRFAARR